MLVGNTTHGWVGFKNIVPNGPQLKEVFGGPQCLFIWTNSIRQKFLLRCCYLLAGFQPKMIIRSTKRTFFNFFKGRFLYFFYLIYNTLANVHNFVYKNVQLNYHRIEIKHIFTSDLKTSTMKKQLIKELKEMMKQGKGYLTVKNFIKDFELTNASVSELQLESTSWTLTIVSGHKYQYFTGLNFGW